MAKRSNFKRLPRDLYCTIDMRAGDALAPHLAAGTKFIEPCAGAWDLAAQLVAHGHICMDASDMKPLTDGVRKADALKLQPQPYAVITNPPWTRKVMHPMILRFLTSAPEAWLLFDANWFHTDQAIPYLRYCTDVVTIGRLLWIPGTTTRGKDDAAWYRFTRDATGEIRAWPKQQPTRPGSGIGRKSSDGSEAIPLKASSAK